MASDRSRALALDVTLFLGGDVMTGRAIDQILPHPGQARIYEQYAQSALYYVELAERANGAISRPVDFSYIWGDALAEFERVRPDARIVNLETAVTTRDEPWPGKFVHYRMHPRNVGCLRAAHIDCCVLANNHVLDWGPGALTQTLDTLHEAGVKTAGAGADRDAAQSPAVLPTKEGRVLVFSFAGPDCGVPEEWIAGQKRLGIALLPDFSDRTLEPIVRKIAATKKPGDIVVVSIHWGGNWGDAIPEAHRRFAHRLLDAAGVDLVHGHSSHHAKGIEVYRERLILYGCGDLINDYEGIDSPGPWRSDLALLYFARLERATGRLLGLSMTPLRLCRMRLQHATKLEATGLLDMFRREGRELGTRFASSNQGQIVWTPS